ncbi:hypothetical protein QQP08_020694 [Theobroma cacao]|nr:hypothetical protein QQP08_020694 [Theobroma cacao]
MYASGVSFLLRMFLGYGLVFLTQILKENLDLLCLKHIGYFGECLDGNRNWNWLLLIFDFVRTKCCLVIFSGLVCECF